MFYALDLSGQRIEPVFSGLKGYCPLCKSPVIAKCGDIKRRHWSHLSERDCDPWAESLTEWHIAWQKLLETRREAKTEVIITKNGVSHRADAVLPDGKIIEIQHSSLLAPEIREREEFYGENMFWIFDARKPFEEYRLGLFNIDYPFGGTKHKFKWKQARKSITFAERKVFLDLGHGNLFEIEQLNPGPPLIGIGKIHHSDYLQDNL